MPVLSLACRHRGALGVALSLLALASATTDQVRGGAMEPSEKQTPAALRAYVGTYTSGKTPSKGIYLLELDLASGRLTARDAGPKLPDPSFLAIHPSRKFLYAVNEVGEFNGKKGGGVSALAIDPATGGLKLLNQQSSVGSGPCHLTVDRTGKNVLVANYGSGSVACLPIQADGTLGAASAFIQHEGKGADPSRQEGPHAHSINLDAANRFAFVADLGLDKVLVYRFDADKGTLDAQRSAVRHGRARGSGPRHFAFHPGGTLRLRDQRDGQHGDRLRLRSRQAGP